MENPQSLTRKARALESAGQDEGALGLYLQAIAAGPEPEANLLARAGVLQLRLGRVDDAADTLARASDLYAAAGQRNNALALCHRVLRADADRPEFVRRAAELAALQGYRSDAAALRARLAELTGEELPAAAAPASVPAEVAPRRAPSPTDDFGLVPTLAADEPEVEDEGEDEDEDDRESEDSLPVLSSEVPASAREAEAGIAPLEGLETTHAGASWSGSAGPDDSLGLMDNALEPAPTRRVETPTAPAVTPEPPAPAEQVEDDLPLLAPEPAPRAEPVADPVADLRARLAADPADLAAHGKLVELLSRDSGAGVDDALGAAHRAFAAAGRYAEAADYAHRLSLLRPADATALHAWAELAYRSGDRARLVSAYLAVARRFAEAGQVEPARKVFERVLKLDPGNEEARVGAGIATPPPAEGEYVDLASMVLEEEPSTRFQVAAAYPSGDEEQDFEDILSAFREQIASGIDPADTASHYDLGIAFKEMGLWDDAITQLERALKAGSAPLPTLEMLGECYYEKGDHDAAIQVLERAEQLPGSSEEDLAGVHYWLGRAHEARGAPAPARASYERAVTVEPAFRDAAARLEALGSG